MDYRKFGDHNLAVSEIGLGGEWLNGLDRNLVKKIIQKAIDKGITFFDFLFNELTYIKNIAQAIKGQRDKIILQTHLGTGEKDGKPNRDRNIKHNRKYFERTLNLFNTDFIDVVNIQFIKEREYETVVGKNGLLNLAIQLKEEGKVRYIGASTHNIAIGKKLAKIETIDSIMFPINIANHYLEGRKEFLEVCEQNNVAVISIKPFLGGKLFESNQTVYVAKYQSGGISKRKKIPKNVTPAQCLHYCLNQKAISTVIPGVSSLQEIEHILKYNKIGEKEKDFVSFFKAYHGKAFEER